MSGEDEICWACGGLDSSACVVCNIPEPGAVNEIEESSSDNEDPINDRQDSQAHPLEVQKEDPKQESVGLNPLMMQLVDNPRDYNLSLLVQSEGYLHNNNWETALELTNRCCRNLEKHIAACDGQGFQPGETLPLIYRGERELLCLAFAHRSRCFLLKQDYVQVIDDCKRFSRFCEGVFEGGNPEIMRKFEQDVISDYASGSTFLGQMPIIGAAAEIANQCRERVGSGWAPKLVLDHTQKAISGLEPLNFRIFPGLNSLRAHLHVTRAHACLELEMWDDAKIDAEAALACDPQFTEAQYMLESAENEEW